MFASRQAPEGTGILHQRVDQIGDNKLHFRVGHMDDAERLIKTYHYSRRMAGNVQFVCTWHESGGLFGDRGEAVAACTFSIPGTRWAYPVLELSRLVRAPHVTAPLTSFLSLACRMLKKNNQSLVVSFADATQDHHGGIYQAASWAFSNYREPRQDGLLVDGVFIPGRSCNSRWGTSSPTKLGERLGAERVVPHMDAGKYLYWKWLNRAGKAQAQAMGLLNLPYPKPSVPDLFIASPPTPQPEQIALAI